MSARSLRADVRNPLLQLEAARQLAELPPESQAALRALLLAIRADARARADLAWKKHKAPMAAYWKAVAVYANHTARLLRGEPRPCELLRVLEAVLAFEDPDSRADLERDPALRLEREQAIGRAEAAIAKARRAAREAA
jgi:hypothetical protein